MSFKTIMTHLSNAELDPAFVQKCVALTQSWQSHLDITCHGVDRMTAGFNYGGVDPVMLQQSFTAALENAQELSNALRAKLGNSDVRWSVEHSVTALGNLGHAVAQRARFSDLVILPQPYGDGQNEDGEIILEGALFDGQSPVLVIPKDAPATPNPKTIVIAWNESRESLNAIRAALPLLKTADHVRVTVIDPPRHSRERSDPGGPVSIFLARHGVKAEIDVLGKSMPRVSDVLLRHAVDKKADLIVMGAYGHSRLREAILGGATRDMLEQTQSAVLMAH